jgi:hypothetical protein
MEGKIDRHLFRYAGLCAPSNMGTMAFSNTPKDYTLLKTLSVLMGNDSVCPRIGGIDDKHCNMEWII